MSMDKPNFFQLVERMRNAQKEYFKTRSHEVLIESKNLERQVDQQIQENKIRPKYVRIILEVADGTIIGSKDINVEDILNGGEIR